MRLIRAAGLVTVQDLGWSGLRSIGMPPGGAADRPALRIGNALVGNPDGAAGLEVALGDVEVEFLTSTVFAATGAVGTFQLDGTEMPAWTTLTAGPGRRCRLAPSREGRFACLALGGGIDLPLLLGSRSTYLPAALGGHQGRRLAAGDVLPVGASPASRPVLGTTGRADQDFAHPIRIAPGPQDRLFGADAFEQLAAGSYRLSPTSDRMGSRLVGGRIRARQTATLPSESTAVGAIQVPDDGQPIVILPDGPTVGGYLKIGVVITADLPRFAQVPLGGEVRFEWVAVAEAQRLAHRAADGLARLIHEIRGGTGR